MVGITSTPESYNMIARLNCSLSWQGRVVVIAAITACCAVLAVVFWLAGAWLVAPFVGVEVLAVACAFYYIGRRSLDYESVTVEGDDLVVEKREAGKIRRYEFQRYWVRVTLRQIPNGNQRLYVRSHGREVELGQYMNNEECLVVAQQLQMRTGG